MKAWTSGLVLAAIVGSVAAASAQTTTPSTTQSGQAASAQATQPAPAPAPAPAASRRFLERINITAIPAGALWVSKGKTSAQPRFDSYVPGGAFGVRLTEWIEVEGEAAVGIGRTQDLKFNDVNLGRFKTPTILGYSGNVVVNLLRADRMVVPYATGGIGGVRVFKRSELGITSGENHLTGDAGVGAKVMWGPIGVRGDYRWFALRVNNSDPSFVGTDTRWGQRVYAGLVIAPGRSRTSN